MGVTAGKLRSSAWFEGIDKTGFLHRAVQRQLGLPDHVFQGKPIIGICNSWSELNPCNASLRELAEHVKRGVWEAGGVPLEFPAMSLGEDTLRPNAMLFRNLAGHGGRGIDPRQPARRRRAAGRLRQDHAGAADGRGQRRPADDRRLRRSDAERALPRPADRHRHATPGGFAEELSRRPDRPGRVSGGRERHQPLARHLQDHGHGLDHGLPCARRWAWRCRRTPPSPAVDASRQALAHERGGNRIVELVREDLPPVALPDPTAFDNAIRANAAHRRLDQRRRPPAGARRPGSACRLTLDDWDRLGRDVPCIVDLKPSGALPDGGVLRRRRLAGGDASGLLDAGLLDGDAPTVTGRTLGENCADARMLEREVIRPLRRPVAAAGRHRGAARQPRPGRRGHQAVRRHAPPAAATAARRWCSRASSDYHARIDDPDLDVDADLVLVLKGCRPKGYPGMPEVGNMGLPPKLLRAGGSPTWCASPTRA